MTEARPEAPEPGPPDSSADRRMADLLADTSSAAELRRRLQGDATAAPDREDLLARVNALEFVDAVVGGVDLPAAIGGYRIQGLLGRGGMGTVYLAFQQQLERIVALKVLSPNWSADPTMRERFRAEARATAALHHRHIVPIYDFGEAQGSLYFAMERVDGLSLDRHIAAARRRGQPPMAPLEAARRFAGVADALGLAHRRRILHRDIKPGNILVGQDGTLALTDFGLAKVLDRASLRLTSKSGGFLGTLHYSSPEQALGREVGPASDLYGLGVTLFEAITGELPHRGRTTEAVLREILEGEPRRLRELLPRPPRDLELVLDKLMAREPGDRYQDGEALARDLQRIADGEPVHIRRLPVWVRAWRRARKNPLLAGAMVTAAVLLLATLGLWSGLRREKGQGLVSRHQNHLVQIANDVKREAGDPAGPAGLLACLTGTSLPQATENTTLLAAIAAAQAEVPDDPVPAALRAAWREDPAPEVSGLLRAGRGLAALQRLRAPIEGALAERTGGDLSVELRLYRLYLLRAVANLTGAVGDLPAARMDLALATFLRPGATFPRLLGEVLDVVTTRAVGTALLSFEQELGRRSVEERRVAGLLLRAAAALPQPPGANLLPLPLPHPDRHLLAAAAEALLAGSVLPVTAGAPSLEAQLLGAAIEASRHGGDLLALQGALQRGRALLAEVAPEAPLQCWRLVLDLIEQTPSADTPMLVGADDPPALVLAAWERFALLGTARFRVAAWLPSFVRFEQEHGDLTGLPRTAALVRRAAGQLTEPLAQAWVDAAPRDPDALLCRLEARLLLRRFPQAVDDGMAAVQFAADRATAARAVAALFAAATERAMLGEKIYLQRVTAVFAEAGT